MNATDISTDVLVLRKTPYSDTSLIIAGLSPEHGQIHLLARGARRTGKRDFPVVDLFRVIRVEFRQGKGELYTLRSADLVADFAGVARHMEAFDAAGWLARLALGNVMQGVAHPRFFKALTVALERLARPQAGGALHPGLRRGCVVGCALILLDESGLLPDYHGNQQAADQCRQLLRAAVGDADLPQITEATWDRLHTWTFSLLHYAECKVPD